MTTVSTTASRLDRTSRGHYDGPPIPVAANSPDVGKIRAAIAQPTNVAPRERSGDSNWGEGTVVAILDTGYLANPLLERSLLREPGAEKATVPEADLDRWYLSTNGLSAATGHGGFIGGIVLQYAPAANSSSAA